MAKQRLLAQVDSLRQSLIQHQEVLTEILPYTSAIAPLPNAVILGYHFPEELRMNTSATLVIDIANTSQTEALGITVRVHPDSSMEIKSSPSLLIERLAAGSTTECIVHFIPKADHGMFTISSEISQGTGDWMLGFYSLSPERTVPVLSPVPPTRRLSTSSSGGAGGMIVMILGLFIIMSGLMVTLSTRNRLRGKTAGLSKTPASFTKGASAWLWNPSQNTFQPVLLGSRVGRSKECDIRLLDPTVSRYHAVFNFSQGIWYVQDLGSTSGTFVNGTRVHVAPLHDGDIVAFGATRMTFRMS